VRYVRRIPLGHNHDFELWKKASTAASVGHPTYDNLADNWQDGVSLRHPRTALMNSLLELQGHLCAWTGQRVELDSAHIDHVVPQAEDPTLDLVYDNLVAAFPKSGADASYGAHVRGDSWDSSMVRPNFADCEHRLRYLPSGKVVERLNGDAGARFTINELKLDHPALIEARRAAIVGYKMRKTWVSDLNQLRVLSNSNKPGRLPRFAPAITGALP
jgi:uncharacterized protein (TIGR02646 family)